MGGLRKQKVLAPDWELAMKCPHNMNKYKEKLKWLSWFFF